MIQILHMLAFCCCPAVAQGMATLQQVQNDVAQHQANHQRQIQLLHTWGRWETWPVAQLPCKARASCGHEAAVACGPLDQNLL